MGEIIVPPSLGGLTLFKYLIIFTFVIHLPFICSLMGSVLLSLGFGAFGKDQKNDTYLRLSKDLVDKTSVNLGVGILLGVLPLFTLIVMYLQLMYGARTMMSLQWLAVLGLSMVGIVFVYAYKNSFSKRDENFLVHFGIGKTAFGILALTYFVFLSNKTFILYPHNWAIVEYPIFQSFSSVNLTQFMHFMLLCIAFAGASMIFHFRLWANKEEQEENKDYYNFATKVGLYCVLVGTLLQPVVGIVDLYFLPEAAVSTVTSNLYIANVVWGMVICLSVLAALRYCGQPEKGVSTLMIFCITVLCAFMVANQLTVMVVVLISIGNIVAYLVKQTPGHITEKWIVALVFGSLALTLGSDFHTRNNSMKEHIQYLTEIAPKVVHVGNPADAGKKIYQEKCNICHTLDGTPGAAPSFLGIYGRKQIVVTNGEEREITADDEYIINSMMNPNDDVVKGFQAVMPPPNLSQEEMESVIAFMKTLKE
ncbi:cytochrome c family protein [Candidatus Uabimicrobium sp. HlEnr_7]|uniref:c-type cytochrome n=1 Tax=Candidatus Uabimicrobium helgolandensis TaxID=3095367 RepID=UPI003558B248